MRKNKNIFGGIIETHVKQPKSSKFIYEILSGWSYEDNYCFLELGKIWVVWHPSVKVNFFRKSLHMITCEVLLPDTRIWYVISVVYASNSKEERTTLWEEIVETSTMSSVSGRPWMVLGDFNQVLHPDDHSKPPTLNVDRKTRELRE